MSRKDIGRRLAAEIAVNALRIDIESAGNILRKTICGICHGERDWKRPYHTHDPLAGEIH